MKERMRYLVSLLAALTALALTASLTFGATPESAGWGLANAASHAGKTVPVAGGAEPVTPGDDESDDEDAEEEGSVDEPEDDQDVEEPADEEGAQGEHCATDPSLATPEELAAMNHGAVVCWAASQDEWPAWFANHGAFVRCWAHHGKADATSCTEDPALDGSDADAASSERTSDRGKASRGMGHGKAGGKGKGKPNRD